MTSVREQRQAANIYKVIQQHPTAKFIVHAGRGHLAESGPMMGAQLRELLQQEDLLTIDQVQLENSRPIIDTLTGDTIRSTFPYLLQDNLTRKFFHYFQGEQVDYTIFNATVPDSLSRPGFLFTDVEKRIPYFLGKEKLTDCPCMFSAYYLDELNKEKNNAVAIDVLYVRTSSVHIPLLLYKGGYTVIKKNRLNQYSHFTLHN